MTHAELAPPAKKTARFNSPIFISAFPISQNPIAKKPSLMTTAQSGETDCSSLPTLALKTG